jgi:hypothetical protein
VPPSATPSAGPQLRERWSTLFSAAEAYSIYARDSTSHGTIVGNMQSRMGGEPLNLLICKVAVRGRSRHRTRCILRMCIFPLLDGTSDWSALTI